MSALLVATSALFKLPMLFLIFEMSATSALVFVVVVVDDVVDVDVVVEELRTNMLMG